MYSPIFYIYVLKFVYSKYINGLCVKSSRRNLSTCVFFIILLLFGLLLFFGCLSVCLIRMQRCYFCLRPSAPFIFYFFSYFFLLFFSFPLWVFQRFCSIFAFAIHTVHIYMYICIYCTSRNQHMRRAFAPVRHLNAHACCLRNKHFACGLWFAFACTHIFIYMFICSLLSLEKCVIPDTTWSAFSNSIHMVRIAAAHRPCVSNYYNLSITEINT